MPAAHLLHCWQGASSYELTPPAPSLSGALEPQLYLQQAWHHIFGLPPCCLGRTCMEHSMHSWLRHARAPAQHEHKHTCAAVIGTPQPLLWHAATRGWCACRRLSWFHGPVRMPALCLVQAARDRATCSEGSYEVAPTSSQFAHSAVLGPSRRLRGLFGRLLPRHSLGRSLCSCWAGWDRDGGGF